MADMRIVRSDGAELYATGNFSTNGWTVAWQGMQDFLSLPLSISTSANVLTDGSTLVSKRVDECERTASIVYVGTRSRAEVRDQALSFFNPKFSFEVHVTHLGRTRWCEGELAEVSCPIREDRRPCECTFTLLCLDPYMRSEDGNFNSLTDEIPMFGFPFVSHARRPLPDGSKKPVGFLASKMMYDGLNTVYNSGDVETMYKIVMTAKGRVESPTFTKDGRFVKVLTDFDDGDVLEIDFTKAPPAVTINGENSIQMCSRDSNFTDMEMSVGENVFNYTCDNESNRPYMDVQIQFYRKYLGV